MTIVYSRLSMVFKLQFFLLNSDNAVGSTATLDLINTVQDYVSLIFNGLTFLKIKRYFFIFYLIIMQIGNFRIHVLYVTLTPCLVFVPFFSHNMLFLSLLKKFLQFTVQVLSHLSLT